MNNKTAIKMRPLKSYVLRAMREWMIESGTTPEIIVDTTHQGVVLPAHVMKNPLVVLNIADGAVNHIEIGEAAISMQTRFSGQAHSVQVPIGAVQAIQVRENATAYNLPPNEEEANAGEDPQAHEQAKRPTLRVVK